MKKLLLVDDDRLFIEEFANYLRKRGFIAHTVPDGTDVLYHIRDDWFDYMITDLNMPFMGGIELIEFLKEHKIFKPEKIIVFSGEISGSDRKKLLNLGVIHIIDKQDYNDVVKVINS